MPLVGQRLGAGALMVVVAIGCLCPPAAVASERASDGDGASPSAEDKTRAKGLYESGLAKYRKGDYAGAVVDLLEANRYFSSPLFAYNISLAFEGQGDVAKALAWLRAYLAKSPSPPEPSVKARFDRLVVKLRAAGLQQVTIVSEPHLASAVIDGKPAGETPLTVELAPGEHELVLSAAGRRDLSTRFDLPSDQPIDLHYALPERPAVPLAATPPQTPPRSPAPPGPGALVAPAVSTVSAPLKTQTMSATTMLAWGAVGTGILSLGAAATFELLRRQADQRAQSAAQVDFQARYDDMARDRTLARTFLIAGVGVATLGTVGLLLLSRPERPAPLALGVCGVPALCLSTQRDWL